MWKYSRNVAVNMKTPNRSMKIAAAYLVFDIFIFIMFALRKLPAPTHARNTIIPVGSCRIRSDSKLARNVQERPPQLG